MSSVKGKKDPHGYWRLGAGDSFSDFTIVVESSTEGGSVKSAKEKNAACPAKATYHVHRSHLCRGPRYSGYFRQLFESDFQENKEACARFTFSSDMALEFPAFLDFLYGESVPEHGKPDPRPCSIHMRDSQPWSLGKLGDYFGVESLLHTSAWHCAQEMFLLTKAQFEEKSQGMPSALLVCILEKVMEIAKGREYQAANCKRVDYPIRMI
jgi:hypothetical protein